MGLEKNTTTKKKISSPHLQPSIEDGLNAQIKLLEMWKALNVEDYPLKIKQQVLNSQGAATRAALGGRPTM